jgi:RNase adaptor protein for sRNA GlmZ degradation
MTTAPGPRVRLISFGYLHGPAPEADLTLDVRRTLRDPATIRDAGLLDSDGRNPDVQNVVLATPGGPEAIDTLTRFVATQSIHRITVLAVGCGGGKHRSAGLTELAAIQLRAVGYEVDVQHLHIHLPRVLHNTNTVH